MTATAPEERPDIIIDIDRLRRNCMNNENIISELLLHLCGTSGPKWTAAIEDALSRHKSEDIREVCHGMKGACATIFAWRLSNIALEFEQLARNEKLDVIAARMDELRHRFAEIETWVAENL